MKFSIFYRMIYLPYFLAVGDQQKMPLKQYGQELPNNYIKKIIRPLANMQLKSFSFFFPNTIKSNTFTLLRSYLSELTELTALEILKLGRFLVHKRKEFFQQWKVDAALEPIDTTIFFIILIKTGQFCDQTRRFIPLKFNGVSRLHFCANFYHHFSSMLETIIKRKNNLFLF